MGFFGAAQSNTGGGQSLEQLWCLGRKVRVRRDLRPSPNPNNWKLSAGQQATVIGGAVNADGTGFLIIQGKIAQVQCGFNDVEPLSKVGEVPPPPRRTMFGWKEGYR